MTVDPFAEWPSEHHEDEIEREERRWAQSPPCPLPEAPSDDPYCAEHGQRFDPAVGCTGCTA